MSDCPSNIIVNTPQGNTQTQVDFIQGICNQLIEYFNKYNISNIQPSKRIGSVYAIFSENADQYDKELKVLIDVVQEYANNYKDKFDDTGGDFSFTELTQYDSEILAAKGVELKSRLDDLRAQCWACHTGDIWSSTCTLCHTVADSCPSGYSCSCDSTCFSETICTCVSTCYGLHDCQCVSARYTFTCGCYVTSYNAGVYTYTAFCGCNAACYLEGCSTCDLTCYYDGQCEYCHSTCYTFSCICYSTCYGHGCSCDATCYYYAPDCRQCYGTVY